MNRSSDEDDRESKIVETVFEQNKKFLSISEIFTDLAMMDCSLFFPTTNNERHTAATATTTTAASAITATTSTTRITAAIQNVNSTHNSSKIHHERPFGCGSVARAVPSNTRGPQFESSHH